MTIKGFPLNGLRDRPSCLVPGASLLRRYGGKTGSAGVEVRPASRSHQYHNAKAEALTIHPITQSAPRSTKQIIYSRNDWLQWGYFPNILGKKLALFENNYFYFCSQSLAWLRAKLWKSNFLTPCRPGGLNIVVNNIRRGSPLKRTWPLGWRYTHDWGFYQLEYTAE